MNHFIEHQLKICYKNICLTRLNDIKIVLHIYILEVRLKDKVNIMIIVSMRKALKRLRIHLYYK